ncbi:MAG: hypothetical protein NTU61_00300 [Candidatus Altiarchaeota archaeon]|nr:hypothetical protein [Candidatus Altiarchaeota archaeon]
MNLIALYGAILGIVSSLILAYMLTSKRTFNLVYRKFTALLCTAFFLFAVSSTFEYLGFRLVRDVCNLLVAAMLFFAMWYHMRDILKQVNPEFKTPISRSK